MQLRFNESQIRYYADKYKEDHPVYDNPIERIVDRVKERGHLTKSDLIAVSEWVKNRSTHLIRSNSDDFVEEMTGFALSSHTPERDRIDYLRRLNGVGWSVASAILHWFHTDPYPIWTGTARYSVSIDENRATPEIGEWDEYVSFCRRLANRNNVNIRRTLDRALWKYCDDQRV